MSLAASASSTVLGIDGSSTIVSGILIRSAKKGDHFAEAPFSADAPEAIVATLETLIHQAIGKSSE